MLRICHQCGENLFVKKGLCLNPNCVSRPHAACMRSCKHSCFVQSACSRQFWTCIVGDFSSRDGIVHDMAGLHLDALVQGSSIWNPRHFNGVMTREFIKRQLQSSRMRPKGQGKHHRVGYFGKGKAKATSRADTNLTNTESGDEPMQPEQDPIKIESESEASPISEAETTIMPTPGHTPTCSMQASSSIVQSGFLCVACGWLLFSTAAVHKLRGSHTLSCESLTPL